MAAKKKEPATAPTEDAVKWDEERKSALERGLLGLAKLRDDPKRARAAIIMAIHEAIIGPFGGYRNVNGNYQHVKGDEHLAEYEQKQLIRSIEQLSDTLIKEIGGMAASAGFATIKGSVNSVTLKKGGFSATFAGEVEATNGVVLSQLDGKSLIMVIADSEEYPLTNHNWKPVSKQLDMLGHNGGPDLTDMSPLNVQRLKDGNFEFNEEGDFINPETNEPMFPEEALDYLDAKEQATA